MSELTDYAREELKRAGFFDDGSDYGGMLGPSVMLLVEEFAKEEHSGGSAMMAMSLFEKVARFEPLTPLTGNDDEWTEVAEGIWQNRRCPHVFKGADQRAYDLDAVIFRQPNGVCFTSSNSRRFIEFPYTPKREYVDVPAEASP